jgi:hypothetical protein
MKNPVLAGNGGDFVIGSNGVILKIRLQAPAALLLADSP